MSALATVTAQCFAKLNLFLDITGVLPNGFHKLNNVTQSVSLSDTVTVGVQRADGFYCRITCDNAELPTDGRNTAYKAAKAFTKEAGINAEIHISVKKRIPIMGGMGGSSVDAAAVICALNYLLGTSYPAETLCRIGDTVGADVGLCILGGTVMSNDPFKKPKVQSDCFFVCVRPDFKCSTADAYKLYDRSPVPANKGFEDFCERLERNGIAACCDGIYNIFTLLHNDGRILRIKQRLMQLGALNAELTGSGSVIYGIFDDAAAANTACAVLCTEYPSAFVCRPVPDGVLLFK